MMKLEIEVKQQTVKLLGNNVLIAESKNYVYANFDFTEDWLDLVKTVFFKQGENTFITLVLDQNNSCLIPKELLVADGEFTIHVVGSDNDVRITTNPLRIFVKGNQIITGDNTGIPTVDFLTESVTTVKKYRDEAEEFANNANTAKDAAVLAASNVKECETKAFKAAEAAAKSAGEASDSAKAAAESAKGIGDAEEKAKGYAEEAKKQADSAGVSAKSAGDSATKAVESALSSGHAAGAAGEAANAAERAAQEAKTSETSAEKAATEAVSSKVAAEGSASDALQAKTAAESAKAAASNSANEAESFKTAAVICANNARDSETAAGVSAAAAKDAETNSAKSAVSADASATAAAAAVNSVEAAKVLAAASAAGAKTSETNAAGSETAASVSVETAASSAAVAIESKIAAAESENNANTFKNLAQEAANTASGSASVATTEANRAKTEADRAVEAAQQAAAGGVRSVDGIGPDENGNVNTKKYVHPTSGVATGAYTKVEVDTQGHVVSGSNPNTLAGYGISDAKITGGVITLGGNTITPLTASSAIDASKITGVVKIENLPPTVIERIKTVENDAARFALTASTVQNGDTVKVVATGLMYYVKDDTKLGAEEGYEVYTAGAAASVPWSGITGLPSTFAPSVHNHKGSEIALTGYTKAEAAAAITSADSLNVAIGKLEKALDGKQAAGDYAPENHEHNVMLGATASAAGKAGFVPAPVAGRQESFLAGDGTWKAPANNKVTQTVTTTNAEYPLLLAMTANQTATTTEGIRFAGSVSYNPGTKVLTADTFKGKLDGNANTATKATQDGDGNNIVITYATKKELTDKAAKATTLAGYGITDAKIAGGVITLGGSSMTPLTQHQDLSAYAKLASPNFTEIPKAPTAVAGTNTHQLANTAFVQQELKNYVKTTTENTFSNKNTFEKTITTISDFQTYEEVTDDKTLTADSANWQIVTLAKDITLTIDNSNMVLGKIKVYQVQVTTGIVAAVNGYKLKIATNAGLIASPIFYPNGEIPILQEQQGLLLTITVTSDLMHGIFCYVGTVCDGLEG
ncbi:MAG TPA: hypothetical protein OIL90_09745 [Phascolarctobacterium faecium]|uniref:hypothetical protein n=1 Tax=Phascolarctobacterium faecium TaxID=33025 RepID=UPI00242BF2FA|nr:hypothetical protein [Phascolarctobacterium faecium]HJI10387.1 hypothetical protein [Phascolarctobacterium faecium]